MSTDNTADGEVRLERRAVRSRAELYLRIFVWMHGLGLPRAALHTYAAFYALLTAKKNATATTAALLTGKSLRSVRRDVAVIDRAGLWLKRARFLGGRRVANEIVLLWQPCMPESLRGAPVDNVAQRVGTGPHGSVALGRFAVAISSPLKISAEGTAGQAKHRQAVHAHAELAVPPELLAELEAAAGGRGEDCLRVMGQLTATMLTSEAKAATIDGMRRLIARAQRGPVTNPAGLLRSHIGPEAIAALPPALAELRRLEQNAVTSWNAIAWARTGFLFLRSVRVFENHNKIYAQQHRAMFGEEPHLSLTLLEVPLRDFLAEARTLYDAKRVAEDSGAARSSVEDGLLRLERRIDEHLASLRGAAE